MVSQNHTYALLRDGMQVLLRPYTPADRPAVEAFFATVTVESRTYRFHAAVQVTASLVDIATSGHTLVAEMQGRIVAVGSYYQLRDPRRAEVALAVEDAQQGRGIGTAMLERLATDARGEGIDRFVALVMADNARMLEVFENLGFSTTRRLEDGEWEYEISLTPGPASLLQADERRHVAAQASLTPLFHPKAVAVIGASRRPGTPGHEIFRNLLNGGFDGAVYPVNHAAHSVASVRAYPTVADVPEPVDLVVIAVPPASVLDVARESLDAGARALVVISSGFAEAGADGKRRQEELLHLVRSRSARLVGPNCLGVLSAESASTLNATFASVLPSPGGVAIASQSGALGIAILDHAQKTGMGVSAFVSMGNKADVSSNDLLEFWEDDPETRVIVLYLESFGNPRRFARVARRVGRSKAIVAVKGGRGEAGMRAAQSHTAALAGSGIAVDALFGQAGVTHCETLDEAFGAALVFEKQPLPAGNRVGIVSNAGGLGILCADASEANGLALPAFSQKTLATLQGLLSPAMHAANPLDIGASASAEVYREALRAVLEDPGIDAVIALFVPLATNSLEDAAKALIAVEETGTSKPVLACFAGYEWPGTMPAPASNIPVFRFPEAAARALGHAAARAAWLRRTEGTLPGYEADVEAGRTVVLGALERERSVWLTPDEVRALLNAYRITMPRSIEARSAEEASEACRQIAAPVAVKLVSRTILHKTDVGGVRLDIREPEVAAEAFRTMQRGLEERGLASAFEGVLVQEMVTGGVECLIGLVRDPAFGPLLAFGLGGTLAEVMGDVAFRLHPLTDVDAEELLGSVKTAKLLAGYRGDPPADVGALKELLLRVSQMVEDRPEITEIDLNPVIALPSGAYALDARIHVERSP